jgi:DNA-binding NarL/FixJ family response regulator
MVTELEPAPPSSQNVPAPVIALFGRGDPFVTPSSPLEELVTGRLRLAQVVRQDTTIFVRIERSLPVKAICLTRRERRVFELLLAGRSQKQIAYDVGVSFTTVNTHVQAALRKLGLGRSEHAIVVAAALSGKAGGRLWLSPPALASTFAGEEREWTLRVELSRSALHALTDAEREVALLVVDGSTNAEIGSARGSSPRTVANQVAAVFRKLEAHGRLELVRRLIHRRPSQSGEFRLLPEGAERLSELGGAERPAAGYDVPHSWMKGPSVG